MTRPLRYLFALATLGSIACGSGVSSDEQARRAYLGLDLSVGKAIQLGLDGFNAASSANIPAQMTAGDLMGTLRITGQVDQGASANKGMRLMAELVSYSDDGKLIYDAPAGTSTELGITLKGYTSASGALEGTLNKTMTMSGELDGTVTLNLTFTGTTTYDSGAKIVSRVLGTTHIVGTAMSGGGTYQVDVTR